MKLKIITDDNIAVSVPGQIADHMLIIHNEQKVVRFTPAIKGIKGDKGDPGTDQIEQIAGQNLSSGRAVIKSGGKVYYFNPNDLDHAGKTIGITTTSALSDETVTITFSGIITDAAFNFEEGQALYIGLNGQLFETVQNVLILQRAGASIDYNKILIDFFSPIIKI